MVGGAFGYHGNLSVLMFGTDVIFFCSVCNKIGLNNYSFNESIVLIAGH